MPRRVKEDNRTRLDALMRSDRARYERQATRVLSGDAERGSEAVQEACLRACKTAAQYQPPAQGEAGGFEAWFRQIVRNVCLDFRRQEQRQPETSSFSAMPPDVQDNCFADQSAPDPYECLEFDGTVRIDGEPSDLFRFLTPDQQAILRDVYVEDNEEVDIARRDAHTPGAVRSRLMAARRGLKVAVVAADAWADIVALEALEEPGRDRRELRGE